MNNDTSILPETQEKTPVSENRIVKTSAGLAESTELWQNKILPFAIILLSALVLVFVILYAIETKNIQRSFLQNSNYDILHVSKELNKQNMPMQDKMYNAEMISLLNRHYHASLIVKSRILTLNLSFLTGMILCFMGGIFVLGKFSESATTVTASDGTRNLAFSSASPGIFLSALGVFLIAISIFSKSSLDVRDLPTYVNRVGSVVPAGSTATPGEIPLTEAVRDTGEKADTGKLDLLKQFTR